MKICILEDDRTQTQRMMEYLTRYQQEHGEFSYVLETYSQAFDLLDAYRGDADLMFLDIRLPDQLGIETARRIREKDTRVMIVFVTNLAQYAIEGYSVQAHDVYLHTGNEVIKQWGTLSHYEELLRGAHFARCSTSCLVNLKYVRAVQKDRVIVGQDSLTVTRTRRKDFLQALAQYKGGTP